MASQTVILRALDAHRGQFGAHTTVNSADASGGVSLVPARTGLTGVIDALVISFGAAVTCKLTDSAGELLQPIYGAANTTWNLPDKALIKATGDNKAISFTADSGDITVFAVYHYE